ncbi:hypothetical protein [Austwickia sp. TVS 96-490-7B]|uniref:hypothetical protein n=1 Tax=Austwickia sp. TVS 96-490-7B TaxID=2830843 RepID=UPI001C56CD2C|nr:hypothetical protein [Austwickia sp. TVS 96-490-7B]
MPGTLRRHRPTLRAISPEGSPMTSDDTPGTAYLPCPEPELVVPHQRTRRTERVTGVLLRGIEPASRLLVPAEGRALHLLDADPDLPDGSTLTVDGYRDPTTATTGQQGEPFVVTAIIHVTPT